MPELILESVYALGCRDLACFLQNILYYLYCLFTEPDMLLSFQVNNNDNGTCNCLAVVLCTKSMKLCFTHSIEPSFVVVVTCSSFKFPPTALDEETSENFRDRESQVHDHLLQLWCYLMSKDCLHSVIPDFLCSSILCFTVYFCFCTQQRYYVYFCASVHSRGIMFICPAVRLSVCLLTPISRGVIYLYFVEWKDFRVNAVNNVVF